jgi:hypothetical protein
VHLNSLGAAGNLLQTDGEIMIGAGGVHLDGFTQHGGTLDSNGAIELESFTQTGGATATDGDFSVSGNFTQSTDGSVSVGGDANITDTIGGMTLGNLSSGGGLHVVSTAGDIAQANDTTLSISGRTTVEAGNHSVVLDGSNNNFVGPFDANAKDIEVVDGHGGLILGEIESSGTFSANSTDGDLTQSNSSTISVNGATTVNSGSHNITLNGANNDFVGAFNAGGNNIAVTDDHDGLVLGDIDASDTFSATSTNGNITQSGGSTISVGDNATLQAPGNLVTLNPSGNTFGGDLSIVDANPTARPSTVLPPVPPPTAPTLTLPTPRTSPTFANVSLRSVSVLLVDARSDQQYDLVMVEVPSEMTSTGFTFALPKEVMQDVSANARISATREDGRRLPAWLSFDAKRQSFAATAIPASALPLRTTVTIGERPVIVVISLEGGG